MATRDQKLAQISELLTQLVCFTQEEVDEYEEAAQKMYDEGLDAFIDFLQDAKKQQDAFFARRVEEDSSFPAKMKRFLKKTTNRLRREYEATQKSKADDILKELEDV